VLLWVDGNKIYSDIVQLDQVDVSFRLDLDKTLFNYDIKRLQILDARLAVADTVLFVGQVLEDFDNPEPYAIGKRFEYKLKRRWHFW